jgi:hypothetical protein
VPCLMTPEATFAALLCWSSNLQTAHTYTHAHIFH